VAGGVKEAQTMNGLNRIGVAVAAGRWFFCVAGVLLLSIAAFAQGSSIRGQVTDPQGLTVAGAKVTLIAPGGALAAETTTDEQGNFLFRDAGPGTYTLTAKAAGLRTVTRSVSVEAGGPNVVQIQFTQVASQKGVVIVSSTLNPGIDQRNDEVYKRTLFERDDQLLEFLGAGINAGQHEGGGKSLEVRRFGFNLDHGGVNGGLKVVVNDLPQNQASQGHGQGYLGALKTLTPELVQDVSILNGPFSAEYGDFSGLGVVQIRTRESLPDEITWRTQAGSFNTYRTFLAYSPAIEKVDSFISYEGSYTNGPFLNHLRYKRNNFTGNYTWHFAQDQDLGFKMNFGTNYFYSSGQIPLDLVAAGELDRFGFIDPSDGGKVRLGTAALYYRKQIGSEDSFKADLFLGRSLFDLYSNFTFFLNDPVRGDGIQQHDSRYHEGLNTQYLHFYKIHGAQALLTLGTNFHASEINVGLYAQEGRVPFAVTTRSYLLIPNYAGYAQQSVEVFDGRLHLEGGLRWDYFRWTDDDRIDPGISGTVGAGRLQPKAAIAYTPSTRIPLALSFNYGRGINTQDARGILASPDSPRIATTDFYQFGAAYNRQRFSLSVDAFWIDRSNEQVYIPDDGTFEFKGPSRSYGYEGKGAIRITRHLVLNGSLTQVTQSFFRGTSPRVYVDSSPHNVEDAGLTISGWGGVFSSIRWRHVGNYRLDGLDPTIRASGLDVVDLALSKQIRPWVDLNFDIDNLTNKKYYETQNYFESRVTPAADPVSRIHGTPGYPIGVTVGLTFHLLAKAR
jgi:outer membrane receptor protein involved in Fe transport